ESNCVERGLSVLTVLLADRNQQVAVVIGGLFVAGTVGGQNQFVSLVNHCLLLSVCLYLYYNALGTQKGPRVADVQLFSATSPIASIKSVSLYPVPKS